MNLAEPSLDKPAAVTRNNASRKQAWEAALKSADKVVVEGLQKVRDGVKVRPTAAKAAPDTTAGA